MENQTEKITVQDSRARKKSVPRQFVDVLNRCFPKLDSTLQIDYLEATPVLHCVLEVANKEFERESIESSKWKPEGLNESMVIISVPPERQCLYHICE